MKIKSPWQVNFLAYYESTDHALKIKEILKFKILLDTYTDGVESRLSWTTLFFRSSVKFSVFILDNFRIRCTIRCIFQFETKLK